MNVLLYPSKLIAITADTTDHGYNAYDFGWTDDDGSGDLGRNCWLHACADGIVQQIVNSHPSYPDDEGYGNYIVIYYPKLGMTSLFAHILKDSFVVKVGDYVKQRQRVCKQDNSGYSFGDHLHMEICKGKTFVRHGGIDYIKQKAIFADSWNIVRQYSIDDYGVAVLLIEPVLQDVTKNQVYVKDDDLRVRKEPSLNGTVAGYAVAGYYDYTETVEADGFIWCKVGTYWIAGNSDSSEIKPAVFVPVERDVTQNQAEVTIDDLRIRKEPSLNAEILGYVPEGIYNVEESKADDDYVWFKVCGCWMAFTDGVIYHSAKEDPKDKEIRELQEQVARLQEEIKLQDSIITDREKELSIYRASVDAVYEAVRPFYEPLN